NAADSLARSARPSQRWDHLDRHPDQRRADRAVLRAPAGALNQWCFGFWSTVPGSDASTDHTKLSMIAIESYKPSLVSQSAIRSVMISPPTTLPLVVSKPVPTPGRLLAPRATGWPLAAAFAGGLS